MSKALEEVIQYYNEDVAEINKHWIIFVKTAINVIITSVVILFIYAKSKHWINLLANTVNNTFDKIPFKIKEYIYPALIIVLILSAIVKFIETYIVYKTVSLKINNIQIKGKSGLANIGTVNAGLEQIGYVKVFTPFWGRIFKYGSIEIALGGNSFTMTEMVNAEPFQDAVIMLQETQKEGRHIREAERTERTLQAQTAAHIQALNGISQNLASISSNHRVAIESEEQILLDNQMEE